MTTPTKFCPRCRRLRPMTRRVWAFNGRGAPAEACRACGGVPAPTVSAPLRIEEILALAAEGLSDKEICRRLGMAHSTIRNHLERHYQRSGVYCRTGAVVAWLLSDDCTEAQRDRLRRRFRVRLAPVEGVA